MAEGNVNDKARMSDPVQEETAQEQITELQVLQGVTDLLKSLIYYSSIASIYSLWIYENGYTFVKHKVQQ